MHIEDTLWMRLLEIWNDGICKMYGEMIASSARWKYSSLLHPIAAWLPWNQVRLGVCGRRWSGSEFSLWDACGAPVEKTAPKGWLVVWTILYIFVFSPYIGNSHPNWLVFFREVETTNQMAMEKGKWCETEAVDAFFFLRRLILIWWFQRCRHRPSFASEYDLEAGGWKHQASILKQPRE